jgi:PAS domain S-box-containing protein
MAGKKYSVSETLGTAQLLKRQREAIHAAWVERLKGPWGEEGRVKVDEITREKSRNQDLFSILLRRMSGKAEDNKRELNPVLSKVRSEHYTLDDFLQETTCLEDAVEDGLRLSKGATELQVLGAMNHVRKTLEAISRTVTQETSAIYEKIVESGTRGFCLFDTRGVIASTNGEMNRLLGVQSAVGLSLRSFLDAAGRSLLREVLSAGERRELPLRKLMLLQRGGNRIPVGVEMASVFIRDEHKGGYLCAVDLSNPERQERVILDRFPLGAIKLTLEGKFNYMNPVALQMLGIDNYKGRTIEDVFPDEELCSKVREKLADRNNLQSEEYEIESTRWTDGVKVPIRITAMPELDLQGNVVGSLALVRDLTQEKVTELINVYLSSTRDYKAILKYTATEIARLIPFDYFIVTFYSRDMIHLRKFFSCGPSGRIESDERWWEISEPLRDQVQGQDIRIIRNLGEYLDEPANRHLNNLREYQILLKEKFNSSMTYPIVQDDQVIAAISFLSKKRNSYGEEQERLVKALPLEKIVLLAIQGEKTKDQDLRRELVGEIVSNYDQVDKVVIDKIGARYPWDHVSLFIVEEKNRLFRLLQQRAQGKAKPLPKNYTQPLKQGVLGYAYETARQVLIQDTWQDPAFQDIYQDAIRGMRSEFCIPILFREKVRWLLNIEDSYKNAFSPEEEASLVSLVKDISEALERSWMRSVLGAAMKSTSDIIFVTDGMGRIDWPNQETIDQLGYTLGALREMELTSLFVEPDTVKAFLVSSRSVPKEVNLLTKNKRKVPVLLSTSELPAEFGGNVIICKDLSLYKRVEELEYLKKMFHEIAIQTKIPLSLAFGWIQRLHDGTEDEKTADILDKAMIQLKKLDLTYSRLALYERKEESLPYHRVSMNFRIVVDQLLGRLPEAECRSIVPCYESEDLHLKGDPFQLSFCVEAILSYLLRYLPPDERINLAVWKENKRIVTTISGFLPRLDDPKSGDSGKLDAASYTLMQMALGDEIIRHFIIQDHKGRYDRQRGEGSREVFKIQLPVD